ncbi:Sodium/sulfate symporter [Chlamydoabsidia padenii]|nr:Sodium/sulfate symporter [Chlamydoabsidia padenii]
MDVKFTQLLKDNAVPAWWNKYMDCCWGLITIPTRHLRQSICFLLAVILFIALLNIDCFGNHQENYCFALLVFAAILWATEAIPLYATSLALPFLIVILGVMRNPKDGSPISASAASKAVFGAMFSSTIMMLLGGFALAAALGKYGIAKAFATHVLSRAGTRPRWVLLAIMLVAGFLSMWISNVATPVLCFSLIEPLLRTLPGGYEDDDDNDDDSAMEKPRLKPSTSSSSSVVGSCLILGIALASCIGGMTSPISSPQNIITLQYMNPTPGWGVWFMVAMPISIISIFVCWFLLLVVYRPDHTSPHLTKMIPSSINNSNRKTQVVVMIITLFTIALWCAETTLVAYLGSTGIVATLPLFMFFGTGILDKEDLNGFLWSVVVLAQGGMALGEAVTSSGLLQDIALRLKSMVEHLPVIGILAIFAILVLVFATFVSHTVAALIIIPIVQQVGQQLPVPHPNLLVMGAGLACSAGMGLPISGYPNMSAIMLEDASGKPYLTTKDFVVTGVLTSIICCLLVITMGYGIMFSLGY